MRCPKCSFENPKGMAFCGKCGTALAATAAAPAAAESFCPRCRARMPRGASFCGVCGENLTGPAATVPPARETAPAPAPARDPAPPRSEVRSAARAELRGPEQALREMVLVPGGWFAMGSPPGAGKEDERPQHQVQLSAFYIDRFAVSNAEYERFDAAHRRLRPAEADGDGDPAVFVAYEDCLNYCRWRAQQEGLMSDSYLLPTEAQWEYAARGGYPERLYPWGSTVSADVCNTREAGRGRTVPVAEGPPNGFHLVHLGDNVREWCLDYYAETYYARLEASVLDPKGPPPSLTVRMKVVRGASYLDPAEALGRCTARNYAHPKTGTSDTGFRCVRRVR